METTLNNELPAAEICRRNGWTAGTLLAGDEGYGITVIEITAVGKLNILAQTVSHDGEPWDDTEDECEWTLWCRDWKAVHNAGGNGPSA